MEFNFKGKNYILDEVFWEKQYQEHPMPNSTIDFQYQQIQYLIEIYDWVALENRINNMLKWGGLNEKNS